MFSICPALPHDPSAVMSVVVFNCNAPYIIYSFTLYRQFSVSHASTSDAGVYVCIVQADEIQGTSTNATITVIACE